MRILDREGRRAVAAHYAHPGHRMHVRWKLANDPVYAATAELLGDSTMPLLDIGCGIGLLGQYLHAIGARVQYAGVDHDPRKIATALTAARDADVAHDMRLECADAIAMPSIQGHVALLDVLHYLPATRQQSLLQAATRHLAPTGMLIIRNVLREPNWRFHATRVEEYFLRTSGWIPGGAQHYPTVDEIRLPLENAGLHVSVGPLRGRTPYNSYLLVARPLQ